MEHNEIDHFCVTPLKLDFSESLPGLHGTSTHYEKTGNVLLTRRGGHNAFKILV